eukprot:14159734-Alexandrium_andersonii.AAC.1
MPAKRQPRWGLRGVRVGEASQPGPAEDVLMAEPAADASQQGVAPPMPTGRRRPPGGRARRWAVSVQPARTQMASCRGCGEAFAAGALR